MYVDDILLPAESSTRLAEVKKGISDRHIVFVVHMQAPSRGDNVLDLILSSNKELVDNVTVVEPLGTSDHSQIHFNLIVKTGSRYSKQRKRDFKKGDCTNEKLFRKYEVG